MARVPLSQLDNWNLVNQGQEIRGLRLVDAAGHTIGLIAELMVDTDAGYVDAVVLDSGLEIPADDIDIGADIVYLLRPTALPNTAPPVEAPAAAPRPAVQRVDNLRIPVVEEQVQIGTRQVEGGGVRVRATVEEVPVTEQVTVRHEKVTLERRPVHRPVEAGDNGAFQEGTYEIRARAEEVDIDKQLYVVEELHINKELVEHTETVQETVRRMRVDVENLPDAGPAPDPGRTYTP